MMWIKKMLYMSFLFMNSILAGNIYIPCNNEYVCPKITYLDYEGISGHTTYQLSLISMANSNVKNIYAIFGDSDYTMYIPPAYQLTQPFGCNIGGCDMTYSNYAPTLYDSWLTIGITDGDIYHQLSTVNIDYNFWSNTEPLIINNGAIFLMDPEKGTCDRDCIIAQLTIPSNTNSNMVVNAQGRTNTPLSENINDDNWSANNIEFPINTGH